MATRSATPVPPEAHERADSLPHGAGIVLSLPFVFAFWALVWLLA